ncbi:hypothetical protein D3C81_1482770 [compost metagenome]
MQCRGDRHVEADQTEQLGARHAIHIRFYPEITGLLGRGDDAPGSLQLGGAGREVERTLDLRHIAQALAEADLVEHHVAGLIEDGVAAAGLAGAVR